MSRIELGAADVRRMNWFGLKPAVAKIISAPAINPAVRAIGRAVLPRSLAQRLPLNKRSVTYDLDDGSTIVLLDPLHDTFARDIYWGRGKPTDAAERHKLAAVERLSKKAATFVDIGAYAGLCSLVAARANPTLKAIAYDIVPENIALLTRNIQANDLASRVDPKLRGIGAAHGSMTVPRQFGAASLLSSISLGSEFAEGEAVGIVPLDDELREVAAPALIKIDVEGFEDEVFRGGRSFFREQRPDIICEILPGAWESCATISEMLSPLGYRWYCFEEDGPKASPRLEPREVMRDWLFSADRALSDWAAAGQGEQARVP